MSIDVDRVKEHFTLLSVAKDYMLRVTQSIHVCAPGGMLVTYCFGPMGVINLNLLERKNILSINNNVIYKLKIYEATV